MARRNFYIVLGVPPGASAARIRSAYRTLAKAFHPDRSGPSGTAQFREISEAYRVLSDPALRAAHNAALEQERAAEPTVGWGPKGIEPLIAEPIVHRENFQMSHPSTDEDLVDRTMRYVPHRRVPKSHLRRQADIDVILTPEEAMLGGTLPIEAPALSLCAACDGSGRDWFSFCLSCGGAGVREGRRILHLKIPEMVRDGTVWEIPVLEGAVSLRVRIRIDPYGS